MFISRERLQELFNGFKRQRVAVIGDVMLDRYIWGAVNRISPEAPVPVVDVNSESEHPGGASNVALNVRTLGAQALMFGVVGDDRDSERLRDLLRGASIDERCLVRDGSRPTTVKTRVIAGSQHVVRIDYEKRTAIPDAVRDALLHEFERLIDEIDAVILQDYNKGVIDERMIESVVKLANEKRKPICVDPKFRNFFSYARTTVFKPNRKESEDALTRTISTEEEYRSAAEEIQQRLSCDNVLLTLGEKGMLLLEKDGNALRIPTRARKVADVSGAGDTVISTLAVMIATGATVREASVVANMAGGLVCEEVGIVPIDRARLFDATLEYDQVD